jgi:hypothetical protein
MKPGVLNTFVRPEGSTVMNPSTEALESQIDDVPTMSTYGPGARTLMTAQWERPLAAGAAAKPKVAEPAATSAASFMLRIIMNLRP